MKPRVLLALGLLAACATKSEPQPKAVPPAPTAAARAASAADPWTTPEVKPDPLRHPLFWAIEKDGKTTYFLGTMHLGIDPESRLPKLVWDKLEAAQTFAMETDLATDALDQITRGDGSSLHAELGDAYWAKLEHAIGASTAKRLDGMKPMLAAAQLSTLGLPSTPPMDGVLSGRAMREHKRIVYLEPVELQIHLLDKWTDLRALKEQLDDLELNEQHGKDMLAAYVAGDDQEILALTDSERADSKRHGHSDAEYDAEMEDLLYHRNASWIPELEQLHASGGGFVAVGAMHLIGKRSVLDLLSQRGYKVTRLAP
jgi:uncharacterized protein YbaP (TraB family)